MRKYTEKELQEIADKRKVSEGKKTLFATSDGQFFENKNYAELHKKQNKDMVLFTIETKDVVEVEKLDWRQRVELVKQMGTVEDVEIFLTGETATSVKEAGEERIHELKDTE